MNDYTFVVGINTKNKNKNERYTLPSTGYDCFRNNIWEAFFSLFDFEWKFKYE